MWNSRTRDPITHHKNLQPAQQCHLVAWSVNESESIVITNITKLFLFLSQLEGGALLNPPSCLNDGGSSWIKDRDILAGGGHTSPDLLS